MNRVWVTIVSAIFFMCAGIIITLLAVEKLELKLKSVDVDIYQTLTLIIQFLFFSLGLWTLKTALRSSMTQKKQWLNDSFIKHEANVLLEFKDKTNNLYDIISDINQFYMPRKYAFNPIQGKAKQDRKEEEVSFDKLKFVNNFNFLCEINDFYNKNQGILKKHNLDDGMSTLVFFLKVLQHTEIDYLDYELVSESDELLIFKFKRWAKIIGGFCSSAKIEIDGFDIENLENNSLNYSNMDFDEITAFHEELAKKYLTKLINKIYQLINDIGDKTTYFEEKSEAIRTSGKHFYYFTKMDLP